MMEWGKEPPRVLFAGENWFGSSARACSAALRALGCDVREIDSQTIVPSLRRRPGRILVRVIHRYLAEEYNARVLELAFITKPDLLIAFKGYLLKAATLRKLNASGTMLVNYYPDTSLFAHGEFLPAALPQYDRLFLTKPFGLSDVSALVGHERVEYLPHGYDAEVHRPTALRADEQHRFACDVSVIATHTRSKEQILSELLNVFPDLDLRIWGNGWTERCRTAAVMRRVVGYAAIGGMYAKVIAASRVNLALLSGEVPGASQGDETTTRSFEIPACGGFMVHPRTPEVATFFTEDDEAVYFSTVDELAEKIRWYLAHPKQRMQIAAAGYRRAVPAYAYEARMRRILSWYAQRVGIHCRLSTDDPVTA